VRSKPALNRDVSHIITIKSKEACVSKFHIKEILPGVESISLEGSDGKVLRMEKSSFRRFKLHSKLDLAGVYLLLSTDDNEKQIYIGEGDDVRARLASHSSTKRFWNYIYIFTSDNMNIAFAKNIEHSFILKAKKASRYNVTNIEEGGSKKLGVKDREYLKKLIESYKEVVKFVDLDVFEPTTETLYTYVGDNNSISLQLLDKINKVVLLKEHSKINEEYISHEYFNGNLPNVLLKSGNIFTVTSDIEIMIKCYREGLFNTIQLTKLRDHNDRSLYVTLI